MNKWYGQEYIGNTKKNPNLHLDHWVQSPLLEISTPSFRQRKCKGNRKKLNLPLVPLPVCLLVPKQALYLHSGKLATVFPPGEVDSVTRVFRTGENLDCEARETTSACQPPCLADPLPLIGAAEFWPAPVYLELICGFHPISPKPSQHSLASSKPPWIRIF